MRRIMRQGEQHGRGDAGDRDANRFHGPPRREDRGRRAGVEEQVVAGRERHANPR